MKILIITKNWIGDVLFQVPAIEAIKQAYPESEIVCLVPARCLPVLEGNPAVSRVIPFDERESHRSLMDRVRLVRRLRAEHFDQAYLFHRSRTRALIAWLAGIPRRIGYAKGRARLLTSAVPEPPAPMHHVDYALHLLRQAGLNISEKKAYHLFLLDEDLREAKILMDSEGLERGGFVAFHLGANWEPKRWPARHFAALAELIHERTGMPIVLTGALREKKLSKEVLALCRKARVFDALGKTSLRGAAALFQNAAWVVSGDSGPMHLASGVGTRVVALFGPTDPKLTGPRGTGESLVIDYVPEGCSVPWYGKSLPAGGWMVHISPEKVMQAIQAENWISIPNSGASS